MRTIKHKLHRTSPTYSLKRFNMSYAESSKAAERKALRANTNGRESEYELPW